MLRYLTAGESHGEDLTVIVEGLPANIPFPAACIDKWLAERMKGHGRGGRMKIEKDRVHITGGVRNETTLGSPLTMVVHNKDFKNWQKIMGPGKTAASHVKTALITRPRPGHADLAGGLKYNQKDLRNILERASARETTSRTMAGAAAINFLEQFGVSFACHVVEIGGIALDPSKVMFEKIEKASWDSPVRCVSPSVSKKMVQAIDQAIKKGDTLGGTFEVRVRGLPPGLGSHVQWDRKLDGRLVQSLATIQSVKAVEVGMGQGFAHLPGSKTHDEILYRKGRYTHASNNAGGIEGGMTNGEDVVLRATMKPIPTLRREMKSVDMINHKPFKAKYERSDTCSVPAAAVVGQCTTAFEIASAFLEKFGGDSLEEVKRNYKGYISYLRRR